MSTNHFARFRFNAIERWLPVPIIVIFGTLTWIFRTQINIVFLISLITTIYWIYRLICVWSFYFIIFEERGVFVRRGLLFIPHHFRFDQITNIRTIKPDKHINFQIDRMHEIKLSLARLEKKDRIRFIFLIESDVNRLAINAKS